MAEWLVVGATGLVGKEVVDRLAGVVRLTTLTRRPVAAPVHRAIVANSAEWSASIANVHFDGLIIALGTTIAAAGSRAAFTAIDETLALAMARAARGRGASRVIAVSAVGADAASRSFYLATKGRVEIGLAEAGFARTDILRPGLLRGDRTGATRPGERLALRLSPLTDALTPHKLDRYRSIPAATVAAAIAALVTASALPDGDYVQHSREMWALAAEDAAAD